MTNPRKRISIDEKKKELEERYLESSVDHENKTEIDKKYRSSKMQPHGSTDLLLEEKTEESISPLKKPF